MNWNDCIFGGFFSIFFLGNFFVSTNFIIDDEWVRGFEQQQQ